MYCFRMWFRDKKIELDSFHTPEYWPPPKCMCEELTNPAPKDVTGCHKVSIYFVSNSAIHGRIIYYIWQ